MERTISPGALKGVLNEVVILDVRRQVDYATFGDVMLRSVWRNPEGIDTWLGELPTDRDVVIYCVHGGSVSNSIVDRLRAAGVRARYIEGGIEGWKAAGGVVTAK